MGKSTPKAPTPPDPVATANAQAAANTTAAVTQANLNRIDQVTPQGNLTYSQNGANPDGTPKYTQTQTYSPDEQAKYQQQNDIALKLGGLAGTNIERVNNAQSQPFNYDGMTPLQSGVNTSGLPGLNTAPETPGVMRTAPNAGAVQSTFGTAQPVQDSIAPSGTVQQQLNFNDNTKLPGTDDFGADAKRVSDSVYSQAASRLDPQFQTMQNDLRARLVNSGIPEGSEAFNREMGSYNQQKTDAYGDANYRAIQAGGAEQSRLFGLAMGARQQGAAEDQAGGQFANSAQGQFFGQNAQQMQAFNAAQGQQFGQNQQAAAFGNQAQDQRFTQGLAGTDLYNNAGQMAFDQASSAGAFNNQARSQGFNEGAANLASNNAARQQQIQESTYLRNLPLNEIAALLGTGGSVNNPNFNPVSQVGVAAPDYQGAVYKNYDAANQQYATAQANRSAGLGSIFGLAGSLAPLAFSDRRVKENIKRIGTLYTGIPTYVFNYIGDKLRQFGVMAQDVLKVMPDAVGSVNGIMYVDYRKVYA